MQSLTFATYSYINSAITNGLAPKETISDFSPLVGGRFYTPIFEMESALGDKMFICNYGNLPSKIEMMIKMIGADGVIGYDLLHWDVIKRFSERVGFCSCCQ